MTLENKLNQASISTSSGNSLIRRVGSGGPFTAVSAIVALVLTGFQPKSSAASAILLGWSDSGMHEMNGADVSVFSLLPPSSTIHAQLILDGKLVQATNGLSITYEAIPDATGSVNRTSQGKGNFYQFAQSLFGQPLAPDQGLAGFAMPGPTNRPQEMAFDSAQSLFTAQGIPLTPYDDQGRTNFYPMMRLKAHDATGAVLASTDIVLPVTDQMDCRACHASGSQATARPPAGWVWNCDPDQDYKLNILRYHDNIRAGTGTYTNVLIEVGYNPAGLIATVQAGQPVLCVRCHASNALPGSGAAGMRPFTRLIHTKHAKVLDPDLGLALDDVGNSTACLRCHAGPEIGYVRGVHHNTIAADGSAAMPCQSCHGTLTDIGNKSRLGWLDEPGCQSCHTGTATANSGQLRYTSLFTAPGQVRQPVDLTFATQTNSLSTAFPLFRSARGHGGLFCAACHGAPHSELDSVQPGENVQSQAIQGHLGMLIDCGACHPTTPSDPWTGGPHGMHYAGQEWMPNHPAAVEFFGQPWCATCHGSDLTGGVLSLIPGNRTLQGFDTLNLWRGFQLGCFACHASSVAVNIPATVSNLTTNTSANQAIRMAIKASDQDGDALSYRLVSQPANGTAFVSNNIVTYFPANHFVGTDSFTFSAWDGWTDSNLGTGQVTVQAGDCALSASATAPGAALPGSTVPFRGSGQLNGCVGPVTYAWDFGDGTPPSSAASPCHTYTATGDYAWKLTIMAAGQSNRVSGVITISPELGPPVLLTITQTNGVLNISWPTDRIGTSLEMTSDPTQPEGWLPVVDPILTNVWGFTYQTPLTPDPQFFRVRRVP
jgi:hypothetical protein